MLKRPSEQADDSPAPKQPRHDAGATPATSARPHNRIVLDVGGTRFVSSRSTLEGASTYFRSLLSRWDDDSAEPLFVDADADAFQVLLSYMRVGTVLLPRNDESLCARVLLLAEYLGMEQMLAKVKARTYRHLHPAAFHDDVQLSSAAFDEEVGNISDAIASSVLPERFFAPVTEAPTRTIKALLPAAPGYKCVFTNHVFDHGVVHEIEGTESLPVSERLSVVNWALVEYRDGTRAIDAIVQRDLSSTVDLPWIIPDDAHAKTRSHMCLASEYAEYETGNVYAHWLIETPRAPGQMMPIPPGAARGMWRTPAISSKDLGEAISFLSSDIIKVGDEVRSIRWSGVPPPAPASYNGQITKAGQTPFGKMVSIRCPDGRVTSLPMPYLAASDDEVITDLAFATVENTDPEHKCRAHFFMPRMDGTGNGYLADVIGTTFEGKEFCGFLPAKRS